MSQTRARGWWTGAGAPSVAAGIAVFSMFVWTVGPARIRDGVVSVGWMFPVIIALGGLRFLIRAWAWRLCVEAPHTLRLGHAFAGVLAGDALGNATPLGPLIGEPAKAAFVRTHLPIQPALTALAIENIFYTLATGAMIAAGMLALLFAVDLPDGLRLFSELAVVGMLALLTAALYILWRRPAMISRWLPMVSKPGGRLDGSVERLRALEHEIYSFASRRRGTVLPVALLEVSFHALGVLETYLALMMVLNRPPQLVDTFILEAAQRLIVVAFKVIPFQLGVAEVGAGTVTQLLGLGVDAGGVLAIVRKARMGVWALVGGALFLERR